MNRRDFIGAVGAVALMPSAFADTGTEDSGEDAIAVWDRETELVSPKDYIAYRRILWGPCDFPTNEWDANESKT